MAADEDEFVINVLNEPVDADDQSDDADLSDSDIFHAYSGPGAAGPVAAGEDDDEDNDVVRNDFETSIAQRAQERRKGEV